MTIDQTEQVGPASPTTEKATTTVDTPKLKASCNNCAASKVRCTKERPVCSRCAKRGEDCVYLASKRAGRVARAKSRSPHNIQQPGQHHSESESIPGPSISSASPGSRDNGLSPTSPTHTEPLPENAIAGLDVLAIPDTFSPIPTPGGFLSNSEMDELFASLNEEPEIDDFLASLNGKPENSPQLFRPISELGEPYSSTADLLTAPNGPMDFFFNTHEMNTTPHDTSFELRAVNHVDNVPLNADLHLNNELDLPNGANYCCLTTSANLLKQLFDDAESSVGLQPDQIPSHTVRSNGFHSTTIEVIISKNEEYIEMIYTMLRCQCTHNGYILNMVSMVVLKVLAWYATAVRLGTAIAGGSEIAEPDQHHFGQRRSQHSKPPSEAPPERLIHLSTKAGDYSIVGNKDSRRMTAQLVLSQLHRVQGLVNQITRRFMRQRQQLSLGSTKPSEHQFDTHEDLDSPFSDHMLEQLEANLRQRLRSVWVEMKKIVLEE
ncbi:aflatoxin regulatory protein-domain-containing protein [Lophiotrema nucula]|uniref:Aflatoxin regulatory protein-domain-containing protein n=1 Tax=Lophiotrema nucula TaxID=690887 RepID=A0A6A5ZH17_9PLEO|nr:aflatoxin regulatory protein-domain-containing protein [Lophiotrema nucula]